MGGGQRSKVIAKRLSIGTKKVLRWERVNGIVAQECIGSRWSEGGDGEGTGEENRRLIKIVFSTPIRLQSEGRCKEGV
jgi:hypothetical protein